MQQLILALLICLVFLSQRIAADASACSTVAMRKEVRELTAEEFAEFADAVKAVNEKGVYGDFADLHNKYAMTIHNHPEFLPFHRWFIREFEKQLQIVNPKVSLPYWDWSLDAADPSKSEIFTEKYFGSYSSSPGCIADGPFASFTIKGQSSCVSRGFSSGVNTFYSTELLYNIVHGNYSSYTQFSSSIELPHGTPHIFVGGNMGTMRSPSDPLFYVHHAYIDFLYAVYQTADPSNYHYYEGDPTTIKLTKYNVAVSEAMDYQGMCYDYSNSNGIIAISISKSVASSTTTTSSSGTTDSSSTTTTESPTVTVITTLPTSTSGDYTYYYSTTSYETTSTVTSGTSTYETTSTEYSTQTYTASSTDSTSYSYSTTTYETTSTVTEGTSTYETSSTTSSTITYTITPTDSNTYAYSTSIYVTTTAVTSGTSTSTTTSTTSSRVTYTVTPTTITTTFKPTTTTTSTSYSTSRYLTTTTITSGHKTYTKVKPTSTRITVTVTETIAASSTPIDVPSTIQIQVNGTANVNITIFKNCSPTWNVPPPKVPEWWIRMNHMNATTVANLQDGFHQQFVQIQQQHEAQSGSTSIKFIQKGAYLACTFLVILASLLT